nr:hypothetical protein [uncultured Ruminococcus sp.]
MSDMVKKYVPYAVIIFVVYMLLPLVFLPAAMQKFSPIAYDCVFPLTAIGCAAHYCSKYGLDFLFALIAPIIYLPSMLIYNGGFSSNTLSTNLILLVVYLVAGIFGLFLGDLAFGDKRRQKEKAEQEETEEMLLEARRREKKELETMTKSSRKPERNPHKQERRPSKPARRPAPAPQRTVKDDTDDFDYDKYLSDIDRKQDLNESEIDDILNEYRH